MTKILFPIRIINRMEDVTQNWHSLRPARLNWICHDEYVKLVKQVATESEKLSKSG